ncbi:MAG: ATP-binding cassette domain-containing protein [Lachnospiraceae bacterium]|nr:ATP-binding cassette domain-containing protein [Lachnospiraceae bacterium]
MHRELTSNISLGEIFQERQRVLEHVNLTIADGERIAFVGASGAGKSTLVQLISRFYDVTQGSVKIGGVNVKDIDYEELLSQVSVVFQQSFLTRGSVYENIAMGKEDADLQSVREAAKKAQIDDFIMSLPRENGNYRGT